MKKILNININYLVSSVHQELTKKLRQNNKIITFVPTYEQNDNVYSGGRKKVEPLPGVIVCKCFEKRDRFVFDYKQEKIYRALKNSVSLEEIGLVHASTLFSDGNIAYRLYKKYGIPYIVQVRNTDVNMFFKKRLLLRGRGVEILRGARKIVFLSNSYKNQVINTYVSLEHREEILQKSCLIPNGIDEFWLNNRPSIEHTVDDKYFKVIYVGVIDRNKNLLTTQKALNLLQNRGYQVDFTVVGGIGSKSIYRKIIKDENTKYISWQPKEKLVELYRRNDMFVMPSIYETFGLVYAEAMSQGLPVIYSRNQGFDQQFRDGEVGYPVTSMAAEEIADRMIDIVSNYERIRENCIESAGRFRWDNIAEEYTKIYGEIE